VRGVQNQPEFGKVAPGALNSAISWRYLILSTTNTRMQQVDGPPSTIRNKRMVVTNTRRK
jgi:hypothetical protein